MLLLVKQVMRCSECPCRDVFSPTHETWSSRGFTIDSYKVLVLLWFLWQICAIFLSTLSSDSQNCLRVFEAIQGMETILIVCMQFNNYDKEKYFWKTSKSNMTILNKSISGIAFEPETTGNMQCIQHVNIPTHPILAESDLYDANPEVTTRFQSQASLFSHLYFEHLHVK